MLHSPEYRQRFAADLKKMLPRIPLTKNPEDFKAFAKAGRDPEELFKVRKMTFGRPTAEQKAEGAKHDKTTIIYNSHVKIGNIPLEVYDYVVNGKPAIEWIMERYQVTRDKDSGIVNDPNDWSREHKQPRYIIDLLQRVIRVSMETIKIVATLPALNEQ